jgi:peptidoglycan hydrolase CwlO-like protein
VLDKNVALEKKFLRLENHRVNIENQLENLKATKANLLNQYNALIEKNSQQKKQLQELQKVIAGRKEKVGQ